MNVKIPAVFEPLFQPYRYKVAESGRGTGKSTTVAEVLLLLGAQTPMRILSCREYMSSIRQSSHAQFKQCVEMLGLGDFYEVQQSSIKGANGTEIWYAGLANNPQSVKSIPDLDVCWVDEAAYISEASLDLLIPTVRKQGSELWFTLNPRYPDDAVYKMFLSGNPPPNTLLLHPTLADNIFASDTLLEESETCKLMDPEKYKHVWLGQLQTLCDTRVIRRWRAGTCYPELDRGYQPYWGADFSAGGDDPTVLVKCWTTPEGALYVEAEAYRTHCQVCEISTLFDSIEGSRDQIIRCDASLPLLISQLRRDGFKATAAIKGPGSVEAGINQLNNFSEIIINPRCKDTIEEASKYQWRQNPAGDILPKPVDAWNHCFDAIRYAIEPLTTGAAQAMKKRALAEMAAKLNRPILDEFAAQPYKGFIG